jgi:3',5'-cyclic-AMP phosphodiesterase
MNHLNEPVVCVVPGDLHLTEAGLENHRTALWMAGEVNTLVRPDFVQFIGDNVQNATEDQFHLFRDLAARLRVPWYAVPGDHDVHHDPQAKRFRASVGDTCGTFSLRGFRFIRLNTQEAKPTGISPEQAAWFGKEVDSALALGERVVIFQHNYPFKVWEEFAGPGIDAWREIVQTRRISAIFTGHTHYGQVANDGRNVVVTTRSIGDPEGGPPGYSVIYLNGDDLAINYRSVEEHGPIVLITHPRARLMATGPAHVLRGAGDVRARVWSAATLIEVRGRVDEGQWLTLQPLRGTDYAFSLTDDGLDKGEHTVEVQAEDDQGKTGCQTIIFAVDPTGRFTAVPEVCPRVAGTAFC